MKKDEWCLYIYKKKEAVNQTVYISPLYLFNVSFLVSMASNTESDDDLNEYMQQWEQQGGALGRRGHFVFRLEPSDKGMLVVMVLPEHRIIYEWKTRQRVFQKDMAILCARLKKDWLTL